MRGLEMEVYMDAEGDVGSASDLNKLNDTILLTNSADGSFGSIETASWETPLNVTQNGAGR
jgi:hypothetical protein